MYRGAWEADPDKKLGDWRTRKEARGCWWEGLTQWVNQLLDLKVGNGLGRSGPCSETNDLEAMVTVLLFPDAK